MSKKNILIAAVIAVVVGLGAYLFYLQINILPVEINNEVVPVPVGEDRIEDPDLNREFILYERIGSIQLQKFSRGTELSTIHQRTAVPVNIENRTIYVGDFLAMLVVTEVREGIFYNVDSQVVDGDGWEIRGLNIGVSPLEVTGGGTFTVCCFEATAMGEFYLRTRINGELAVEIPFWVARE